MVDHTIMLVLAQDGSGPASPTEGTPGAPGTATQGAGGGGSGQGLPTGAPGGFGNLLLPMLAIFAVLIIFSFRGQRRDKKKREAMLNAIKKHDKVQTIGGVIGSVVEIKPNTIVLKVDESHNTRITFSRSAVQQIINEDDIAESDAPALTEAAA